jgi:hypothetical protein
MAVDLDREVWSQAVVRAPFADGADQVGLGGLFGHEERILHGVAAENVGLGIGCFTARSPGIAHPFPVAAVPVAVHINDTGSPPSRG